MYFYTPKQNRTANGVLEDKPTYLERIICLNSISRIKYLYIMFLESSHLLPGDLTHPCSSYFSPICPWNARSASIQNTNSLGPMQRFCGLPSITCLPFGLALGFRFCPTLEKISQNLQVRIASENDSAIQSYRSQCFLTVELCWVSGDLGSGVPTTWPFSADTFLPSLNMLLFS